MAGRQKPGLATPATTLPFGKVLGAFSEDLYTSIGLAGIAELTLKRVLFRGSALDVFSYE